MLPNFALHARSVFFEYKALNRWSHLDPTRPGKPHGLPGELIVSLTSYPPRFEELPLTLACLCDQTLRADRIILWIAEDDIAKLPDEVRWDLRRFGVEILECDDLGPFKKLVPALEAFPEAFIATADDDVYYPRDWLESLVIGFDGSSITCLRADQFSHRPCPGWQLDVGPGEPRTDLVPVGVRGTLYPPHSLDPIAIDRAFMRICPRADDFWYYWMGRRIGSKVRKVGARRRAIPWPGTQQCALSNDNCGAGGNDAAVRNLVSAFGWPDTAADR